MKRPFSVWNADNMPVQAPFYKSPSIPYGCKDMRSLEVYAKAKPGVIQKYLEKTPFEWITNDFVLSYGDYANGTSAVYHDMGLIVPVRYKGLYGGYYLMEYEDLASSVAAGRELWGYPKKVADFAAENAVEEGPGTLRGEVSREAHAIIRIEAKRRQEEKNNIPGWNFRPHLLLYTMPRYGGPGIQFQKILKRDTSPDYVLKERVEMSAALTLSSYINPPILEPLGDFQPEIVYGAVYQKGDFTATPEHGWAELVDVVTPDPDCM